MSRRLRRLLYGPVVRVVGTLYLNLSLQNGPSHSLGGGFVRDVGDRDNNRLCWPLSPDASAHNYHVELLYQRRTRRARNVFQRLAKYSHGFKHHWKSQIGRPHFLYGPRESIISFKIGQFLRKIPINGFLDTPVAKFGMGRRIEVSVVVGRVVQHPNVPFGCGFPLDELQGRPRVRSQHSRVSRYFAIDCGAHGENHGPGPAFSWKDLSMRGASYRLC